MKRTPLKRDSSVLGRSRPLGRGKPLRVGGRQPATPAHWRAGVPFGMDGHHVIYAQHVRRSGGDVWDIRNRLVVDQLAHANHHSGAKRIPLHALPDSAFEFAPELLGDRAWFYLRSRYAGTDPRLDALLPRWDAVR